MRRKRVLNVLKYDNSDVLWGHGRSGDWLVLGNYVYTVRWPFVPSHFMTPLQYTVISVTLKVALEVDTWTWVHLYTVAFFAFFISAANTRDATGLGHCMVSVRAHLQLHVYGRWPAWFRCWR